jgi:MFS family permease
VCSPAGGRACRGPSSFFRLGLILPFEIIYMHQARGFATATAGLVLAAVMGTAAVVTPFSGALLDRFRARPILITGNLASALGYAGFAFVDRPWQAFVWPKPSYGCKPTNSCHPSRAFKLLPEASSASP